MPNPPALTPDQRAQVNTWMAAFRYGDKSGAAGELGRVDARKDSGQYDEVTWHIALDGATLYGNDYMFRHFLGQALRNGLTGMAIEKFAWNMTCLEIGLDTDVEADWVKPEWAKHSASYPGGAQ